MCSETIRVVSNMYTQWNEEFGHDLKLLKWLDECWILGPRQGFGL